MATPAAILSILVQTEGARVAAGQIRAVDSAGKSAGGSLKKLEDHSRRAGKTFSLLGTAAKSASLLVGGVGLAKAFGAMNDEYREAQKVGAQTNAVLKSTGDAAKVTKKHIENLAGAISKKSGIDDEAIQSGENLLLTFTAIRNETGKSNKIFDRATQTITDMSVALGQDMKSSAIQVGKALNDPVKGITALRRVGVSFTKQQQDQIKKMAESGNVLGAQKRILRELTKEFGGSAAAQATAGDKLKVSLGNLAEAAGGVLVPQLDKAAVFLTRMIDEFIRGEGIAKVIIPAFFKVRDAVVEVVAALTPVVQTLAPKLVAFFESLPQPIQVATAALAAFALIFAVSGPLGVGLVAFAGAAVLIKRNWDTVGPVLQKTAQIASTVFAALVTAFNAVKTAFQAAVQWVQTAMDNIVTEIHKWDVAAAVVKTALTAIKAALAPGIAAIVVIVRVAMAEIPVIFRTAWNIVKAVFTGAWTAIKAIVTGGLQELHGIIQVIGGIFKGDFGQIWEGIKNVFRGQLKAVAGIVKGSAQMIGDSAVALGKGIADGVITGLGQLGHMILQKFKDAAGFVKSKIGGLFSAVGRVISGNGGDGIGKALAGGSLPAGGAFGGSLMGAQTALKPFAAIGSRFGLSVTSGRRPGAITSSGNISYHSSGEAIDMGDGRGPDANKLNFFKYMKSHFGGRLAELIYTPGGVGIKNGQPFRYTGQVAADHFDHVHVAFDTGKPGVGDGIGRYTNQLRMMGDGLGKFTASAYGPPWGGIQGTGVTATGVNLKDAPHIYGVAVDPSVIPLGSMLKITPNPFGYGGAFKAFDTGGAIKGRRIDFYDWRGRKAQLGWGMRSVTVSAVGNTKKAQGGKSKGDGGKMVPTLTGTPMLPATYDQITAALDLAVAKAGGQDNPAALPALIDRRRALSERAAKINKALRRKNLRPATRARLQTELTGLLGQARDMDAQISALRNPTPAATDTGNGEDPNQPLIDATNALAAIEQQRIDLETQIQANQQRIIALAGQGPQILAAIIAAVNGGIGGQVGLGLQTPGYAGAVASYGGSAGRL